MARYIGVTIEKLIFQAQSEPNSTIDRSSASKKEKKLDPYYLIWEPGPLEPSCFGAN